MKTESSVDTMSPMARTRSSQQQEQSQAAWDPSVSGAQFTCDLLILQMYTTLSSDPRQQLRTFPFLQAHPWWSWNLFPWPFVGPGSFSSMHTTPLAEEKTRLYCGSYFRTSCSLGECSGNQVNILRSMHAIMCCLLCLFIYANMGQKNLSWSENDIS